VLKLFVVGIVIGASGLMAPAALAATSRPAAPTAAAGGAAQLFDLANRERVAAGLSPLEWRDDVAGIAADWTAQMAASGTLAHNDEYFSPATQAEIGSSARGENVAFSGSIEAIHYAFMQSPPHRANILDGDFSQGGFAVTQDADGTWWATEDFMRPAGSRAAAPAPPAPAPAEPEPAPEPVVVEQPAPQPVAAQPVVTEPPATVPPTAPSAVPTEGPSTSVVARNQEWSGDTASAAAVLPLAVLAAGALVLVDGLGLLIARRLLGSKRRSFGQFATH
jgi:hypothetical protein